MDKKTAISKVTITHDRHRADGPRDTFDWFLDAPAGWCFAIDADSRYHFFRCESGTQSEMSYEAHIDSLEPCRCGCDKEAK